MLKQNSVRMRTHFGAVISSTRAVCIVEKFLFLRMPQTVKCGLDERNRNPDVQSFISRFVKGHLCSLRQHSTVNVGNVGQHENLAQVCTDT